MTGSTPRFELLGPFRLVHRGRPVVIGGPTAQAILAVLVCPPDTKVLPDDLVGAVWGSAGGASRDDLHHYVSRLRRVLAPVDLTIVGHRPGYRLPVPAGQVDAVRFDELLRTARALREADPDQAVRRLRAALALWQGPRALDNLAQPGVRRLAAALDARRLDAEEDLAEVELDRGRPEVVLDRLHSLVAAHPGRLGLTGALVRALHATGRVDQAGRVLAGAECAAGRDGADRPHPALVRARRVVSAGKPRSGPPPHTPASVPFQLPADTVHFTGRGDHLARVLALWPEHGQRPATVVVSAVEGMAGIGKTALAVHAAHRLADRFDDGVLFVDLRGFTPDVDPATPEQALDCLLRGLGVPGPQIPSDLDGRAALYRTVLSRRRVLVVLDNAADEAQLRPLLPSTAGCLVLVTSRRHLLALDDAVHLALPVLPAAEAVALFRAVVADRVTAADQVCVERIVALCGHLPLAIRIAAARLRLSRAVTPRQLLAEMADELGEHRRLDWLCDGDRAVAAALAVSYRHLGDEQRRVFRLLGLHPGANVDPYAVAALADTTVEHARRVLADLQAASLADQPAYRRYSLHDLVRTYAASLAAGETGPDPGAATVRLFAHYAHTASVAMDVVYPHEAGHRPRGTAPATPTPAFANRRQAEAWLDAELGNLLATATQGPPEHTRHLSATLRRHLRTRGHYREALALHEHAVTAARAAGDPAGELAAVNALGDIDLVLGRYEQAATSFEQAVAIAERIGDPGGRMVALHGLALFHYVQGRYEQAVAHHREALDLARRIGDRVGEAAVLIDLGCVHHEQGRYDAATDSYQRALGIARDTGNRVGEQAALSGLGTVHYLQGRYDTAADSFTLALELARATGNSISELQALTGLGTVHRLQARYERAADCHRQVMDIATRIGNRNYQFEALYGLGRSHHPTCPEQALAFLRQAFDLAVELGQPADQARAHDGLAHTHLALGHRDQATQHWRHALALLTALATDHTEDGVTTAGIRADLAGLGQPQTEPA